MRTLEFRLALIERRIREGQAEKLGDAASHTGSASCSRKLDRSGASSGGPLASLSAPDAAQTTPCRRLNPPSPPPIAAAARPSPSLEERFGTQWVVWGWRLRRRLRRLFSCCVLSIEQGWFGPGTARVPWCATRALANHGRRMDAPQGN